MTKYRAYAVIETRYVVGEVEADNEESALLLVEDLPRYKSVVHESMRARANFENHESEYVSPDVDDITYVDGED